jgi:hypothetical protein
MVVALVWPPTVSLADPDRMPGAELELAVLVGDGLEHLAGDPPITSARRDEVGGFGSLADLEITLKLAPMTTSQAKDRLIFRPIY